MSTSTSANTYRIAGSAPIKSGTSAKGTAWEIKRVILTDANAEQGRPAPCVVVETFEPVPAVGTIALVAIETSKRIDGSGTMHTDHKAVTFCPVG